MARTLAQLKDQAPAIYWHAVDLAGRGKSVSEIRDEITRMVEGENENRALRGLRSIVVSI